MPEITIFPNVEGEWTDAMDKRVVKTKNDVWQIGVLPHGMQSGKSSLMLRLDMEDGSVVLAQTSLTAFYSAARVLVAQPNLMTELGLSLGAELVVDERRRQKEQERWNAAHDDRHDGGELARAAMCYIASALNSDAMPTGDDNTDRALRTFGYVLPFSMTADSRRAPQAWPWDESWWKPANKTPLRRLVVAAALLTAEIDRRIRAGECVEHAARSLREGEHAEGRTES